jgi:hypothetical protein
MKYSKTNFLINIFVILLLIGLSYYYKDNISNLIRGVLNPTQPCQKPITYSIANLDPRFNLTKAEILDDIKQAEKIWESPINKQLFEYSPTGDLKVNFVYDYRQKATDAMKKIGVVISDDRSSYDTLKSKYDLLVISFNEEKAQLKTLIDAYNIDKSSYEKDVNYWNSQGGTSKTEYNILEQKRIDLNNQIIIINQKQDSLNTLIDTMNSAGIVLNKLIAEFNLQVSKYNNTTNLSTGKEFDEGEYVSDANGTAIDIFQFNDTNQLVRVLAHELGHALGIGHINNPKAIMYYLNEGMNIKLTSDDLAALKKTCGITK